ncbi:MAG: hypothetical protein LBP26_04210 [Clostridiales bacterium]|jgi:predicted DNA-binding protein YlxM (UPF0122 family)|nr:hypothetical protein [Clostridiales bacterium]
MKDLDICRLNDVYGGMLTERAREVVTQYYDCDYSLAEIAENLSVTRQAVHIALKNAVAALQNYEKKLKFAEKAGKISAEARRGASESASDGQRAAFDRILRILD